MSQNCRAQQTELHLKPFLHLDQSDFQGQPDPGEKAKLTLRSLFDAEESALLRYAYSLIGRRAVAEEIVQEVFLQLHTRWNEVDSPRAWLFRSVRNRAFNHRRDNKRETLTCDEQHPQSTSAEIATPEDLLLGQEAAIELRLILEELDEQDRQLVKLKYFENLKYRDISARTGLSISNVGYRLHHLLKELADKLCQLGIDGMS